MRLIDAEQKLLALQQPVLQTRDVSACLNMPPAQASKLLERLVNAGRFKRLMRGKWATSSKLDPLLLPEYLTSPFPSYVSLQTALFYHGIISQIPDSIYAVSLARTRVYHTDFGTISIHHLQPDFFFDFYLIDNIKIATPEKALIDLLYLTHTKSNLFKSIPEIELPDNFSQKKVDFIVNKISSPRIKTIVLNRLKYIYTKSD